MDNCHDLNSIKLAFGLPFFSMDFNELMLTTGELSAAGGKHLFFTASMPWLLDYAKNPILRPLEADYILAADSQLIAMADKIGVKLKMPLEYFEFPEQIARICAHYGYSLLHVSKTALKTDILVSDGYVPLSWDLFTHFKTSGELDEIDALSIVASATDSRPDIVIISAPPESLSRFIPEIYENLHECILLCIPQDVDRNKIEEKIDNVLSPQLLIQEELALHAKLKDSSAVSLSCAISSDNSDERTIIKIQGALNDQIIPELMNRGCRTLQQGRDINLDMSSTSAISLTGLETIHHLCRAAKKLGRKVSILDISEEIINIFHHSGLADCLDDFPGILCELDT